MKLRRSQHTTAQASNRGNLAPFKDATTDGTTNPPDIVPVVPRYQRVSSVIETDSDNFVWQDEILTDQPESVEGYITRIKYR